jgi:hypothetical protein
MPVKNTANKTLDDVIGSIEEIGQGPDQTIETTKSKYKDLPLIKYHENIYDDFHVASDELNDKLVALADKPPENPLLVVSTPGIGKTRAALNLSHKLAELDKTILFAAPTRNMVWQAYDRIKETTHAAQPVVMLEGRHDGYTRTRINKKGETVTQEIGSNCIYYDKIKRASEKGYPSMHYVCMKCHMCPHYRDKKGIKNGWSKEVICEYFNKIAEVTQVREGKNKKAEEKKNKPIVVTTHHMMAVLLCEGSFIKPDWVIVDEDPLNALQETVYWSKKEIERKVIGDAFIQFRAILAECIEIVEEYKPLADFCMGQKASIAKKKSKAAAKIISDIKEGTIFSQTTMGGIKLGRVMYQAAKNLGVDLAEVLETASLTDPGVGRGELLNMPKYMFNQLPHHKEAELARALLDVLEEAQEGEDRVHKVSLRWSDDIGWQFNWHLVRRIKYGGPLIMLDAYGSPIIASQYCGREIDKLEVHCKARNNVTLFHYWIKTTGRVMDNLKDRNKFFDDYVVPDLHRYAGKKLLVYVKKKYKDWFEDRIKKEYIDFEKLVIKWFWMDRGDDSYGDFDGIMIAGTPNPNIVGERHFANALFAGDDEPLNWKKDGKGKYLDERVEACQKIKKQNELQQQIFRIRPSKPRKTPQEIMIYSDMQFDAYVELQGATVVNSKSPTACSQEVFNSFGNIYEELGCWTGVLAAFLFIESMLLKWLKKGGLDSGESFPITYEELKERIQRVKDKGYYEPLKKLVFERGYQLEEKITEYRGKQVRYYGDENNLIGLLDQLRKAIAPGTSLSEQDLQERAEEFDTDHDRCDEVNNKILAEAMERYPEMEPGDSLGGPSQKFIDYVHEQYQKLSDEDPYWFMKPEFRAWAHYLHKEKLKEKALKQAKQEAQVSNVVQLPVVSELTLGELDKNEDKEIMIIIRNGYEGLRRYQQGLSQLPLEQRKEEVAKDMSEFAKIDAQEAQTEQEQDTGPVPLDGGFAVHFTTDTEEEEHGWTSEDGWPWKPLEEEYKKDN